MMVQIAADKEEASKTRAIVEAEEQDANIKAAKTKEIKDDAQRDLDAALPALDAALKSLDSLKKSDIDEVRVMSRPPSGVKLTMEATCIMFSIQPIKVRQGCRAGGSRGHRIPSRSLAPASG